MRIITQFHRVSRDKILHNPWSISVSLFRGVTAHAPPFRTCKMSWGKSFCVSSRGGYKSDFYLKLAPVQVCYIKTCGETTTIKNFPTLTQYRIISLNCFLSVGVHDRKFSDNCIKFLFSFPAPKL